MLCMYHRNAVLLQHFRGISMGIITYVAINLITGKAKEKKISALMYVLAVLFILKYIFL